MKLLPREDIRPEEKCFYVQNENDSLIGYMQLFNDGTAASWFFIGEQAVAAKSPEAAYARLRAAGDRHVPPP
jgi:hypothetical protein